MTEARRRSGGPRMQTMSQAGGFRASHAGAAPPHGGFTGEGQQAVDAPPLRGDERLVLAKVADILRRISYGTVVLVVQDGKVVQIEMAEKFRLR